MQYRNTFGPDAPVLRIADGDTVETTILDAHGYDVACVQAGEPPNPQTGPFYVEGAEPGDAVAVTIEVARPNRDTGWTYTPVASHVVDVDCLFTMGNARPLDEALQHATTEMLRWLAEDYGLGFGAGSTLLGLVVRYEVGNVFDPAYTMVCKVPRAALTGLLRK